MYQAQLALVNPVVIDQARDHNRSISVDQPVRYRYSKMGFGWLKFVIVDVFPDGQEEFAEQEAGEVCWYSFRPSAAEQAAVHALIDNRVDAGRWPLLTFETQASEIAKARMEGQHGLP